MTEGIVSIFKVVKVKGNDADAFKRQLLCITLECIAVAELCKVVGIGNSMQQFALTLFEKSFHELLQSVDDSYADIQQHSDLGQERLVSDGGNEYEEQDVERKEEQQRYQCDLVQQRQLSEFSCEHYD